MSILSQCAMRPVAVLLAGFIGLGAGTVLAPIARAADVADLVQGAMRGGQAEIALGLLSENRDYADALALERHIAQRLGYMAGGDRDMSISWRPVLRYSDNINGGRLQDELTLGGLTFTLGGEMARAGWLAGLSGRAGQVLSLADRLAFRWSLDTELSYAPEHDIHYASLGGRACLQARVTTHGFAEGCLRANGIDRAAGATQATIAEIGYTQVLTGSAWAGALTGRIGRIDRWTEGVPAPGQAFVGLDADLVTGAWGALSAGARLYEEHPDHHRPRERLSVGGRFAVFGRSVQTSLYRTEYRGGRFLGAERESVQTGIVLAIEPVEDLTVSIDYSETDARFDFYDAEGLSVDVGWHF